MVKRETEPDDPEPDDPDPTDPDPEGKAVTPPEPAALGEVDAERMGKALEKANTTYRNALGRIDGLEFDAFAECEKCNGMGFVPPNLEPAPDVLDAPDKVRCHGCNGWGVQATPSLAATHDFEQCITCTGNGWVIKAIEAAQPVYPIHNIPPIQTAPAGYTSDANGLPPQPTTDAWQRPVGHPHFGVPPASLGV